MWGMFSSWTTTLRQLAGPSPPDGPDPAAVKGNLEKLEELRGEIQARIDRIEDGEGNEVLEQSREHYLSELTEISLGTEDVLDECGYELLRAKMEGGKTHEREGGDAPDPAARLLADDPLLRFRMAGQIGEITRRYHEVSVHNGYLRLRKGDGKRRRVRSGQSPSSSLVDKRYVYGRNDDKDILLDYMLSEDCEGRGLTVIPIVGMGLVGKTTLAQLIYNDPDAGDNFDPKGWVSLTKDSDLKRLLERAIESLTSKACRRDQLDTVQGALQQCVQGKRFLLVLDDVCDEHLRFWDEFQASLGSCSRGSVVLITTKIEKVAERTQMTPLIYFLESISEDNCWSTFQRYAFVGRDDVEGLDMAVIRRKVVEICEGMPWVSKLLGVSFRNQRHREDWMDSMERRHRG